jgi:tRNA-2-methylthio-N6-dimethylallyladenosine synthase
MARAVIPGLAVSTDVIVGFPGESDADFEMTMDIVHEARFDSAFMFQFSPRPGTPAATMTGQVPAAVIQERFERLVTLQNEITLVQNERQVGSVQQVMVEGPSRRNPEMATTRTRGNRIVHVSGGWEPGTVFDVLVERAAPHYLEGTLLS